MWSPFEVTEMSEGSDKVVLISAGANYTICYTECGILYYWGMLVPDDYNSIDYYPAFLNISIPEEEHLQSETFL